MSLPVDPRLPINGDVSLLKTRLTEVLRSVGTGVNAIDARLADLGFVSMLTYGAVGDGVTDDYAAWLKAYDALPDKGGVILFPPTTTNIYRFSTTLDIRKPVHIIGAVQASNNTTGTTLYFDQNISGMVFGSAIAKLYDTIAADGMLGSQYSLLENVFVLSAGGATVVDGIVFRASITCRNVTVRGFKRYGFRIYADIGAGGSIEGDANQWRLDNCKAILNGDHGLYVNGADANTGLADKFFSQLNGGYGIYDNSLIGNTYVACDTVGNTSGPMWAANASSAVTVIGLWEDGAGVSTFGANVTSIGANNGGAARSTAGSCMAGGLVYGAPFRYHNSRGSTEVQAALGYNTTDLAAFTFGSGSEGDLSAWKLKYDSTYKGWTLQFADSTSFQPIHYPNSAALLYTNKAFTGSVFQNGYAVKNAGTAYSSSLVRMLGTAAPTSGTYQQGDIFYNSAPASAGYIGWVCTVAGTPGTWKTFGLIS